jgi:hypothetical protein
MDRDSPLKGSYPLPSQKWTDMHTIPPGWRKTWDNLGKVEFVWAPAPAVPKVDAYPDLANMPSWVPNWHAYSSRDPSPLPRLEAPELCYWASGKDRSVEFSPAYGGDLNVLAVRGMRFDVIQTLAPAWCPDNRYMPLSRRGVTILQKWEALALEDVENCPYADVEGGRDEAFWRTHIADYAGQEAVDAKDKVFFDAWREHLEWTTQFLPGHAESEEQPNEPNAISGMIGLNLKQFTDQEWTNTFSELG